MGPPRSHTPALFSIWNRYTECVEPLREKGRTLLLWSSCLTTYWIDPAGCHWRICPMVEASLLVEASLQSETLFGSECTETHQIFVISGRVPTPAPSRSNLSLRPHGPRHTTNRYCTSIRCHRLRRGPAYPLSGFCSGL